MKFIRLLYMGREIERRKACDVQSVRKRLSGGGSIRHLQGRSDLLDSIVTGMRRLARSCPYIKAVLYLTLAKVEEGQIAAGSVQGAGHFPRIFSAG